MAGTATNNGFSLIELIVVIVLTGIIASILGQVLSRPIEGFVDLSNRAALVDTAELALRRMSREIRLALPNSVRITDGTSQNLSTCTAAGATSCAVEILRTADGGRYRAKPGGAGSGCAGPAAQDRLNFTASADCFEVLGTLSTLPLAGGANQLSCLNLPRTSDCLVISNTGQPGANAYNGDNIAGLTAATANSLTFDISGGAATRFPLQSPRQRFHIVDKPVSFTCTAGNINRQADYAITPAQVLTPAGGTGALLANQVSSCIFTYNPGVSSRNGILTVAITMSFTGSAGSLNNIRLVEQIQVPNVP